LRRNSPPARLQRAAMVRFGYHITHLRIVRRNIQNLLTVSALVGLAFGAGLLVAPAALLAIYGLHTSTVGLLLARIAGVEFVGYNIVGWIARVADPFTETSAARTVVHAHLASETLGAIVTGWAAWQRLGNSLLWSVPLLYGVLAIAFLWATLQLRKQQTDFRN